MGSTHTRSSQQALKGSDGPVGLANRMWAEHVLALRAALPGASSGWPPRCCRALRMRKSAAEVEALRRAGAAIDAVHRSMGEWLRVGRTEAEVATDIAAAIRDAGHAAVDFTIVAGGPNGASPHHGTSDRKIGEGEPVVVDIGGTMPDGYCSDSTRVYVVGPPPAEFTRAYDALYAAQRAAVAAVRAGRAGRGDRRHRTRPAHRAGYGERFLHRTGHGIGLDGHEEPYIVAGNDLLARAGDGVLDRAGRVFRRPVRRSYRRHRRMHRRRRRAHEHHPDGSGAAMTVQRLLPTRRGRRSARPRP